MVLNCILSNFISILNTLHKSVPVRKSRLRIYMLKYLGINSAWWQLQVIQGKVYVYEYIYRHNEKGMKAAKCK